MVLKLYLQLIHLNKVFNQNFIYNSLILIITMMIIIIIIKMIIIIIIKFGFDCSRNWYDHEPKPVEESEECKLLWDFPIQTDHKIEHNRPDIEAVDKKERSHT